MNKQWRANSGLPGVPDLLAVMVVPMSPLTFCPPDHVHDLDGIVCILFVFELYKAVPPPSQIITEPLTARVQKHENP